ncbi:PREDICTED: LOC109709874 isoform [Prunus dulcis]|uniref:PREDICTED: LOC109709874 isoform n=1 Tax=Prunus dulcis TaxID=3755 RepID=A0A5E4FGV6_PRUDU|nr:uncharacterized protein LOC117617292 [Prunus dulcis]KAI5345813.1 hypothetical protein L3X38_013690 [Prunus dulcis]VVA27394.1 PREDICTED: LOC109709874 isoform [Prunus dulcis]
MEVFYSSTPTNRKILSLNSPFPANFPAKSWNKKNPCRYNIPSFGFHKNPSFSIYLLSCHSTKFRALAHFGRPISRRNSLRKKLIDEQKVNQISVPLNPSSDFLFLNNNFDDTESPLEKVNYDGVKESEFSNGVVADDSSVAETSSVKEPNAKSLGDSVLLSKLDSWMEQYKRDTEYWGIGSGHIFTVNQDSDGNVKVVSVNEDEILRRSRVERLELEDSAEVNLKILQAESLAREMESGKNVIARNSSVAKFVVEGEDSGFMKGIQGFSFQPEFLPKISRFGRLVLYGFIALWALKKLFTIGNKEERYSELEKEMMRRKIKSRKEKEMLEKGSVEVVQASSELPLGPFKKPSIDKQELMKAVMRENLSNGNLALQDSSTSMIVAENSDFDDKVQEIRNMARQAREIEGREHSLVGTDRKEIQTVNDEISDETVNDGLSDGIVHDEILDEIKVVKQHEEEEANTVTNPLNGDCRQTKGSGDTASLEKLDCAKDGDIQTSSIPHIEVSDDRQSTNQDVRGSEHNLHLTDDSPFRESNKPKNGSIQVKPRVIRSVKEAREYLSKTRDKIKLNEEPQFEPVTGSDALVRLQSDEDSGNNVSQGPVMVNNIFAPEVPDRASDSPSMENACEHCDLKDKKYEDKKIDKPDETEKRYIRDVQKQQVSLDHESNDSDSIREPSVKYENWMEENFNEFEPIAKKIGVGFRDNYMVSREKGDQQSSMSSDMTHLGSNEEDDSELEWLKDDSLREIVLQVQENELGGRDPFYMMDAEDKDAFFKGLEKKVEKENKKLSKLHEWLHSNIENLDYGAEGISLYDPPEKIIPRWKGPPLEKSPEFLNYFQEQRNAIFAGNDGISVKKDEQNILQKSTESQSHENIATSSVVSDPNKKDNRNSKIVIEGSDGSVRAGKKSGKEFWQHTKKWSQGFLESYNAETDQEIKATMRDMGKGLDRWITEKEIQEAADLMNKMPEKNKKFMEKKLSKLKREMELFGPQAVVSKYREYAEDKKEDYLWWLDLPYVLCIELYTVDNEEQRIGFYSLEMAADLELEPKPYHVIAFEDTNDCKNLGYIIQAQMDMFGNGHAFVVAQPPKDVFREAKANGFGVTVIRKGEVQLNVDQTLEEVEEQITEIGSKIYHDKIMQERSMDISSLMKGVFGFSGKPTKRTRSKQTMKTAIGFGGKPAKRKRSKHTLKKPSKKER